MRRRRRRRRRRRENNKNEEEEEEEEEEEGNVVKKGQLAFFDYFNRFLSNRRTHIDPTSTLHRPYQNNQNEEEKKIKLWRRREIKIEEGK